MKKFKTLRLFFAAVMGCPLLLLLSCESAQMSDYKLEVVEIAPGSALEKEYITEDSANVRWMDAGTFRNIDFDWTTVYRFEGTQGQKSYLVVDCGHEIFLEVSTDGANYETAIHLNEHGRSRAERTIDLTPYFEKNDTVYVRGRDAVEKDGWGTLIWNIRYVTLAGAENEAGGLCETINDGWTVISGGKKTKDVFAGTSVAVKAGESARYEREISIPSWWGDNGISLVIPWVESETEPKAYINGKPVVLSIVWGNRLVLPLPEKSAGKKINIAIEAISASEIGGLWSDIYIGLTELVTPPATSWKLDDKVTRLEKNYAPYDLVKLNALAGNFLSTLLDTRYNLLSFDTNLKDTPMYYPHDTSRSLLALADEECWSPIVRLDLIAQLYDGIRKAMVPGSDYEVFLQRDTRPKALREFAGDHSKLEFTSVTDRVETFANMWAELDGGNFDAYEDEWGENSIIRRYARGSATLTMTAEWYQGTEDKPTLLKYKADALTEYSVIAGDLDGKFQNKRLFQVKTPDGFAMNARGNEVTEIEVPDCGFILFQTDPNWLATGTLIIWDTKPEHIKLTCKDGGFDRAELIYSGDAEPAICVISVSDFDNSCDWPFRLAENILKTNSYGTNGFDPSFICGTEGIGTAAFAAAAYIKQKYGLDGAEEAVRAAKLAMDTAVEAAKTRRALPSTFTDRIAACEYLVRMGFDEYADDAAYWADMQMSYQQPDGSFYWFDQRQALSLLRGYEATGNQKYMDAALKFRNTVEYGEESFTYTQAGEVMQGATHQINFGGAGDLGYLGCMGDKDAVDIVLKHFENNINDTGVFNVSDLNPYFLGISLKGTMEKTYEYDELKTIIKRGEYCLYAADGSFEVLKQPTSYIDNPYMFK